MKYFCVRNVSYCFIYYVGVEKQIHDRNRGSMDETVTEDILYIIGQTMVG